MLEYLHIQNYALVDDLELTLTDGLNVLTGETGAGKSIIIGALELILGKRASGELLRQGVDTGSVEACFRMAGNDTLLRQLERIGIDCPERELIVRRVLSRSGRSRCIVNGSLVTLSNLQEIGELLVDLHGQHDHQSLLHPEVHLDLQDEFAKLGTLRKDMEQGCLQIKEIDRRIEELSGDDREFARRVDMLRHEVAEIDPARLSPQEEESLREEAKRLAHTERLAAETAAANHVLAEGEDDKSDVIDRLNHIARVLDELSEFDPRLKEQADLCRSAVVASEELSRFLAGYSEEIEFDPVRLEEVHARLDLIQSLKGKYGATIEEVLAYAETAREELEKLSGREKQLRELQEEREQAHRKAVETAKKLTEERRSAAKRLTVSVQKELAGLGFDGAGFQVRLTPKKEFDTRGADCVEFFISPNPGEGERPLRKIASGGEISRIMLAMKSALATADKIPTLVFDEIDLGIGGTVAARVAEKLRSVSKNHQVLCVTHLPVIASKARTHFCVEKEDASGRTVTRVRPISQSDRLEEIARMLGGGKAGRQHAKELLAEAGKS